jgi:hypothetical protein
MAQAQIVDFKTLLRTAHQKGMKGIETEAMTVKEDFAFFRASVTMQDGSVYTGHGDASPKNVKPQMVIHLIRLAETRAIVRALRLATNIGTVAAEEMADYDHSAPAAVSTGNGINDSGVQCPACHAPAGKPHSAKCTLPAAA